MSARAPMAQSRFSLPEGSAYIAWPEPMSPESFEFFKEWLALVLRSAERSVVDGEKEVKP